MSFSKPVIHLVGSIPLDNAEDVFRSVGGAVGAHLSRLPDGETGKRIRWIFFLEGMLNDHSEMEIDGDAPALQWRQSDGKLLREIPQHKFKDGVDLAQVTFDTGYADAAIASFVEFERLQGDGVIPADVKFQICLPTPCAPGYNFVAPRAQDEFLQVYGSHLVGEVKKICEALPLQRIAFQWDVCQEVLMWEGYYAVQPDDHKEEIFAVLSRMGDGVPEPAELGYHLCYGSPGDEHMVEPGDMANMVEITHGLLATVGRSVQFIHMPVPKGRDDDAYFSPLKSLVLPAGCDLYLGLVHHDDQDGDSRRLAKALEYAEVAGISSECGWGRGDPKRIPGLLVSHAKAVAQLVSG